MACAYYASPLSTACSMVASRPMHAYHDNKQPSSGPPSASAVLGSSGGGSDVYAVGSGTAGSEAAAEHQQLWRPLLQPTFVEGLWMRMQGVWVQLGLLGPSPSDPHAVTHTQTRTTSPTPPPSAANPWALAAFAAAKGLPPPHVLTDLCHQQVACVPGALARISAVMPWVVAQSLQQREGEQGELLRTSLGMCLQLCGAPYGEELRAAMISLRESPLWPGLQQMMRSATASAADSAREGAAGQGIAAMALMPLLAARLPHASPVMLRALADCCMPALLD
jgi:hypothetical protein